MLNAASVTRHEFNHGSGASRSAGLRTGNVPDAVSFVKRVLPASIWGWLRAMRACLVRRYVIRSYSYSGEDMVLRAIFKKRKVKKGFYVDIGAYHPRQLSNTHYFYRNGWRGINVDAQSESMDLFRWLRPGDTNIVAAVTKDHTERTLFVFESPSLNTLDPEIAEARVRGGFRIVREERVKTRTLAEILTEHLPSGQRIDFLSVDVEGYDLDVLMSNDWSTYRPSYVVIESDIEDVEEIRRGAIYEFMREQRYSLVAKTMFSLIFHRVDAEQPDA